MTRKRKHPLSRTRLIALGFFIMILAGTVLLMTPLASRGGESTDFLTALFTATSASCVTGLVVVNTYVQWSLFGQVVILCLIQIGGLGFITIGFAFSLFLRKRISLRERGLLQESINVAHVNGMVRLAKLILCGTAIFEGTGALILTLCFLPDMGLPRALWYGIFHSISAFCNAGFDLMGRFGESSFMGYNDNPVVCLTLIVLILIGGLGFFVWADLKAHKWHLKKYALHTKLVLTFSLILTAGGAVLFYVLERNRLFADMNTLDAAVNALFCAVTPRTAGFNTVDTAALTGASKLLTIVLMFIGGCSGSTAGGVKVTTIAVMLLYMRSMLTRSNGVNCFGRRLSDEAVPKATAVFTINLSLAVTATFLLAAMSNTDLVDLTFEAVSAISTVGMSLGVTSGLNTAGRLIIILLMYLGRVGSLSFAMSLANRKGPEHVRLPKEEISIG